MHQSHSRAGPGAKPGRETRRRGGVALEVGVCRRGVAVALGRRANKRSLARGRAALVGRPLVECGANDGEGTGDRGDMRVRKVRTDLLWRACGVYEVEEVGGLDRVRARAGTGEVVGLGDVVCDADGGA
jgi:hypothetical protein